MSIVRAAQAPRFALGDTSFTVYSGPSNGSQQLCTWRLSVPAGQESIGHTIDRDEVFMILSGQLRLTPDGEVLGAGDAAVVPAGDLIQVTNPGAVRAEVYVAIQAGFTARKPNGETIDTPPWAA